MVEEDAERLAQRLRLSNAESERLMALEALVARFAGSRTRRPRVRCFIISVRNPFADRVLLAWARSEAGAADGAWRHLATLPQRWTAPVFPLKAADFIRRGVAAGRRSAPPCARPRRPGSPRIFRPIVPRSTRSREKLRSARWHADGGARVIRACARSLSHFDETPFAELAAGTSSTSL